MGGNGAFLASGGFSRYEYFASRLLASIKVIKHLSKENAALPRFSETPNAIYLHEDIHGRINEIRIFRDRKAKYDIDWGHQHDGIPQGIPHIHQWVYYKDDGSFIRKSGRRLKKSEMKLFERIMMDIRGKDNEIKL